MVGPVGSGKSTSSAHVFVSSGGFGRASSSPAMTRLLRHGAWKWKRCEPEWIPAASDTSVGCKVRRIYCGVARVWVSRPNYMSYL
ncbi:hypothetical protein Hanom_Chr03g00192701 [Helianthus anomalus]